MTVWQLYLYNVSSHVREALLSTLIPALWKWSIAVLWSMLSRRRRICNFIETLFVSFLFFCSSETQNPSVRTRRCCTSSPPSAKRITRPCWGFQKSWSTWRAPAKVGCRPHANLIASLCTLRNMLHMYHLCYEDDSTSCIYAPQRSVFARPPPPVPPRTPRLPLPLWQDCKGLASLSFGPSIN